MTRVRMLQGRPLAYAHGYGRPPVAANLSPKSLLIVNQLRFDRILYHGDLMPNSDSMAAEATSAKENCYRLRWALPQRSLPLLTEAESGKH